MDNLCDMCRHKGTDWSDGCSAGKIKECDGYDPDPEMVTSTDYSADDRGRIYTKAFLKYGPRNQLVVAIEEMSELQKEICKCLRSGAVVNNNKDRMVDEATDVLIMLEQLLYIFGIKDAVEKHINDKIYRLSKRVGYSERDD